jgi:hypothetical protein
MNYFKKEAQFDDSKLDSKSQLQVASLIKALPDEDLSLSWRSQLNVKLMAAEEAKRKKKQSKRIFAWGTLPFAGVAATAMVLMIGNGAPIGAPVATNSSSAFASELVKTHQESVVLASVSGTGSSVHETSLSEESYNPQDDLL